MRSSHALFCLLGVMLLLSVSPPLRAACNLTGASPDLPKELKQAEHLLDAAERKLEAARKELKLETAAYEAAADDLAKRPRSEAGGTPSAIDSAAAALRAARDASRAADEQLREAEEHRDCILREMQWAQAVTLPLRFAGGAANRWIWGAGARLSVRTTSSPRELHYFGLDYLALKGFGFDEQRYQVAGRDERVFSPYYAYRYKNLIVGPAAAFRVSKHGEDGAMTHPNAWLIGRLAFDVDTQLTLPRVCDGMCFVAGGNIFFESWFPLGERVPVSVLMGLELTVGTGFRLGPAGASDPTPTNPPPELKKE